MSNYIQLGDVHTYYEEDGAGEPLVLLHPGLADSRAFEDYVPELAQHFHVFRPDRRGHGRTPTSRAPSPMRSWPRTPSPSSNRSSAAQPTCWARATGHPWRCWPRWSDPTSSAGWSSAPASSHHDGWAPGAIDLDDETIAFFTDYWGAVAPDGPDHFPVVKAKLDRMHREEPTLTVADLAGYPGPALVMVGDSDEEIPIEHTLALHRGLPNAQLAVLPGTGHGGIDTRIVLNFLTERAAEA